MQPRGYDNNGEQAHLILPRPESWKRRNLRGRSGLSCGSLVESLFFLPPPEGFIELVAERQASKELGDSMANT
jgi:hypothetical protein